MTVLVAAAVGRGMDIPIFVDTGDVRVDSTVLASPVVEVGPFLFDGDVESAEVLFTFAFIV